MREERAVREVDPQGQPGVESSQRTHVGRFRGGQSAPEEKNENYDHVLNVVCKMHLDALLPPLLEGTRR